MTFTGAVYRGL